MLEQYKTLMETYDPRTARLCGGQTVRRRLSQLAGCFADAEAWRKAVGEEDALVYEVSAVEPGDGPGDLHYGLGILHPGKVGNEYFMTRGHLHSTREAAEVYIGLEGEGVMLLEDEQTGESRMEPLGKGRVVYVPGHTAHRTMNTGDAPLTYFGIYPANAGHDYGAIAERNFLKMVVEENGRPVMRDRET